MTHVQGLFVYGTLRDPQLLHEITGKCFPAEEAWLLDYERRQLPGTYPFVVPCKGARVRGIFLRNVDVSSLAALDRYECEGELYDRVVAQVETRQGVELAFVYAARSNCLPWCDPGGS